MNKDILYCDASESSRRQASIAVLSFVSICLPLERTV